VYFEAYKKTNNPWTISYRQPIYIVIQFYEVDIVIERFSAIATLFAFESVDFGISVRYEEAHPTSNQLQGKGIFINKKILLTI
jgi:hypothetical protein